MKKILFSYIFSIATLACTVTGSPVIFTTKNNMTSSFNFDACSSEQVDAFNDILQNSSGTLKQSILNSNSTLANLNLVPKTMRIRSLEEVVSSRLNLTGNIQVEVIDNNINTEILKHNEDDFLSVSCNNCEKSGPQNILITRNSGQTKTTQWIKVSILKSVRAIVTKATIGLDYSGIDASKVELRQVFTDKPNDIFTEFTDISMYRANKTIPKDTIIKLSDLSPIQLVKPGASVKVKMNFDNLNITTKALSINGGFMGDEIKVKNEKTNKIFSARVIGINEVKLDL